MNVPENLAEGLNLAGTGMALVFAALVVFMLILMALQKLFPGEEIEPEVSEASPEPAAEAIQVAEAAPVVEEAPEPPAPVVEQAGGRIPGSQIAAMAVAIYLSMEQQERPQPAAVAVAEPVAAQTPSSQPAATHATTPYGRSSWGRIGREAMLDSQGRRAPSYGHRPQSPFNPRGSERR